VATNLTSQCETLSCKRTTNSTRGSFIAQTSLKVMLYIVELVFHKFLFLGQLEHMFRDCNFNILYICGAMARCCNMWKNGWPKVEIPLEVQRWDNCCHSGKVKAQAWPQSMTMIRKHNNDHKFPNYNIQLAKTKKKHKKPSSSKTQNGHDQNRPTSCNLQKI
jgi:hypothetical protein